MEREARDDVRLDWKRLPVDALPLYRDAVRTGAPCFLASREAGRERDAAFATLPLWGEGRVIGALGLSFRRPRRFPADEQTWMCVMVGQCAQALEWGRLYDAERRARTAVQEALSRLDTLMETVPVGLGFWDTQLRYVRLNEHLARINGVAPREHLGKRVREVLPQLAPQVEPLLHRVLETGQPVLDVEVAGETPARPGGRRHWLASYYPVRDEDGSISGVGVVVVDISEQKGAEEHLRRTAEFRERFMGIVSHDLRNPLNAILLSANALLRSEELEERQAKGARRIIASAERMKRMISDLLDFARGRLGGGIPITRGAVELTALCREVAEELEAGRPGRKVEVEVEGEEELGGEWDADRLSQLLINLGKNALDYSPEESRVRLSLHGEGGRVTQLDLRAGAGALHRGADCTGAWGRGVGALHAGGGHHVHGVAAPASGGDGGSLRGTASPGVPPSRPAPGVPPSVYGTKDMPSTTPSPSGTGVESSGSMTNVPGMFHGSVMIFRIPLSGLSRSSRPGLACDCVATITVPPSGSFRLQR